METSTYIIILIVGLLLYILSPILYGLTLKIDGPFPYPIIGNLFQMLKMGIANFDISLVRKYGGVCRYYEGRKLVILVQDPAMLKEILVKQFSVFKNRQVIGAFNAYPLSNSLPFLKNDEWERVRTISANAFSPNSLKQMSPLIEECVGIALNEIRPYASSGEPCKIDEISKRFSANCIASCLFGVDLKGQSERSNAIVAKMQEMLSIHCKEVKYAVAALFPTLTKLMTYFGMELLKKNCVTFFSNELNQIIESRRQNEEARPDFIQLMVDFERQSADGELSKTSENTSKKRAFLNSDEILGQAMTYFTAGYYTTHSVLSFFIYNMAINPECQQKLHEEIDEIYERDGRFTFENVAEMNYLDNCFSETIRINPPTIRLDRIATHSTYVNGVYIPKNALVIAPLAAISYNSDVFPEPERFDPERTVYSDKTFPSSFKFIPFGEGPRFCIAKRFSTFILKLAIVHIFHSLKVKTCPKTEIPLKLQRGSKNKILNGVYVEIETR